VGLDRQLVLLGRDVLSFDAEVAPHAGTVRWSLTVPSNTVALASFLNLTTSRRVTSPGASLYVAAIRLNNVSFLHQRLGRNDAGFLDVQLATSAFSMLSGDVLNCFTDDVSAGGVVWYKIVAIVERVGV
jgi:hypothetical protein